MFVGEVNTSSNQEPEFSEKEDDEWILVDFIGKVFSAVNHHSKNGNSCLSFCISKPVALKVLKSL